MYKIKNITERGKKFYQPKLGKWITLKPDEEMELGFKPEDHPAFEISEITQSNKKIEVEHKVKEEENFDEEIETNE